MYKNSILATQVSRTLSVSIGICALIPIANAVETNATVIEPTRIVEPEVTLTQVVATPVVANAELFLECGIVQGAPARLACYDKVASTSQSALSEQKNPLDIVRTVESSIHQHRPTVVLANDRIIEQQITSNGQILIEPIAVEATRVVPTSQDVLQRVGVTRSDIERYTHLSLKYDLDSNSERGLWSPRPHEPMYLMPAFINFDPNRTPTSPTLGEQIYDVDEYDPLELKAQISVKTKIGEDLFDTHADLWLGYTQQMHWQVYNEDNSRPFRATDYHPEIFMTQPVTANLPFDGRLRMLGAGAIHHSNGQSDPLSRSWNRIYLTAGAEWGRLSVEPRIWAHIKNETDTNPSDNPDITDYYGHGDIRALYDLGRGQTIAATGRYNFAEQHGALQLDYTHPFNNRVNGFVQLFHGYGESIIDYNEKTTSLGVGVTLNNWRSF